MEFEKSVTINQLESNFSFLFIERNVYLPNFIKFKNYCTDVDVIEGIRAMVFKGTFNNISVTFVYRGGQFLLVEETGVPGENHRPAASH